MCNWPLYKEALSRNIKFHSSDRRIHLRIVSAKSEYALSAPCIALIHKLDSHPNYWQLLYRCWHSSLLPYIFQSYKKISKFILWSRHRATYGCQPFWKDHVDNIMSFDSCFLQKFYLYNNSKFIDSTIKTSTDSETWN